MSGRNPLVYCTIPLVAMQGYHTNTEDTGSFGYNSVCYITSINRISAGILIVLMILIVASISADIIYSADNINSTKC